ncbi:MAG: hypothetical protein ACJ73D_10245 [Pyrinomonadaceae bacterium]
MKRSTKLALSLTGLGIILLIVLAGALGGYWYYRFITNNENAYSAGVDFGKTTDNRGCVNESVRQFAAYKETGFLIRIEQLQIGHFTTGCLGTSQPTPKFCSNVPKDTFLDRLKYTVEQCRAAGLRDGGPCNEIFKSVVVYCSTKPNVN